MKHLEGAIVIAVHLQKKYIDGFIEILQQKSTLNIEKLQKETILQKNRIYICNTKNITLYKRVGNREILYENSFQESIYRPDINMLFSSVARGKPDIENVLAVLLSGIGENGVGGFKELFEKGAKTVAASKESVAIYGMSKRAVQMRACSDILNISEIIEKIEKFLHNG